MRRPLLLLLVLLGCSQLSAAAPWSAYENARFGYRLMLPEGLTLVQRLEDGSGARWQTGTFAVEVFGTNNPYQISPERWFAGVRKAAGDRVVEERRSSPLVSPPWQEVLYLKNGRRHHRKTFVGPGAVVTVEVSYAYRLRQDKQSLGQRVVASLTPGDLTQTR